MNLRREAVTSETYWDFQPGEHVMTVDGYPGVVDEVQDGPVAGSENYVVTLDNGMGGGSYSTSMLTKMPTSRSAAGIHLATDDYPELGTVIEDRPDPGKMTFTAALSQERQEADVEDHDEPGGDDQPNSCSYCGGTDFTDLTDNGRVRQATCATCNGTMSAHPGAQWTPELIGDPSNHPKAIIDPRSGASPGAGAPGQAGINDFIDYNSRVSTTAARDWGFQLHEEQTGGTKFPVKHTLRAHDANSGVSGGHVEYFPPKRKGGPVHVDSIQPTLETPGSGSAMLNEVQNRHPDSTIKFLHEMQRDKNTPSHRNSAHGDPTDWNLWHPGVKEDGIHRGFALRMEPHHAETLNDPSKSKDEHLQALHEAMPEGHKMGMHWTTEGERAKSFAHSGVMDPRRDVPVVLHAKGPERKDIEDRPDHLFRNGVFPYDHISKEREVPIRRGRKVEVTGMSWKPDAEHPDADRNGWVHHTYDEGEAKRHTAAVDGADWCTWRRTARCTFPGDITADGHVLGIPQDRGPCPWETRWQQQVCPISEPGPGAAMERKGSRKTAMPSRSHPEHPEGISYSDYRGRSGQEAGRSWDDAYHLEGEETHPGWEHHLFKAHNGPHEPPHHGENIAGTIFYSKTKEGDPAHPALAIHDMKVYDEHKGNGYGSAMQDELRRRHPEHMFDHGGRSPAGQKWWNSYQDPGDPKLDLDHPDNAHLKDHYRPTELQRNLGESNFYRESRRLTPESGQCSVNITQLKIAGVPSLPERVVSSATTAALEARVASDDEDDYRMQHQAPDADYGAPLHDVTKHMHDFYEHPEYFHGGLPHDHESARVIRDARDQPEKMIHVYRSLPGEHAHKGIRPGDWVSTSKDYARQEGMMSNSKDDYPVIRAKVPAKHLHTEGDVNEWGYNGPDTVHGMVVYKGGHNQEVRHNSEGLIKQVQRRTPKEASETSSAMARLARQMAKVLGPGSANRSESGLSATASSMYHWAPKDAREDIAEHGLDHTRSPHFNPSSPGPHGVFLHHNRALADDWVPDIGHTHDLYAVDTKGLKLHPDPYDTGDASYTPHAIPPERLRHLS